MTLLRRRLLRAGALGAFALSGSALFVWYEGPGAPEPDLEPETNPLIGRPLPAFAVPGLQTADFVAAGGPVLLNFFASWCTPCLQELPVLLGLRRQGLAVWGIAYRDRADATASFLMQHGDPYARIGRDDAGDLGPAFSLSGLPESFLVDRTGVVRWSWAGGLSRDAARASLLAAMK